MSSSHPKPRVLTFDCYGTLVQWHEVYLREIRVVLAEHEYREETAAAILDEFSTQSRRLTSEAPHRLYKDILRIGFTAAFREQGVSLRPDQIERLAFAPGRMGPHPDTPDALQRLKELYKLAIFTNSDDDLIGPTVARIGIPFDFVITSQQARAYKPSQHLFEHAYSEMGVAPEETVHVAMGMYTDMKACHELRVRSIWVNRRGETGNPDWLPYSEVPDLKAAATLLLQS